MCAPLRRRTPSSAVAACVGTKELVAGVPHWLRLRTPATRHGAVPGSRLSRPTRWARSSPGAGPSRCRPRPDGSDGPLGDLARRTPPGRSASGSTAPATRAASSRTWRPRRVGPGARRAGLLRRVLRRVHLGRARPHDPRARARGRRRRPLALEAVEPRRAAGRLLTPGTRTSSRTCRSCASTPGSWSPGPCSTPPRSRSATTPTSTGSGRRTSSASSGLPRCWARPGSTPTCPQGSFYLWVRRPRALSRAGRFRRRRRARRGRLTSGSPSTGASSSRPGDTYGPAGAGHVRVALVQPDDRLELVARRLSGPRSATDATRIASAQMDDLEARRSSRAVGASAGAHARATATPSRSVDEAIDLLDRGEARVAEIDPATDEVVVHEWLRQAILAAVHAVGADDRRARAVRVHRQAAVEARPCSRGRAGASREPRPAGARSSAVASS